MGSDVAMAAKGHVSHPGGDEAGLGLDCINVNILAVMSNYSFERCNH